VVMVMDLRLNTAISIPCRHG